MGGAKAVDTVKNYRTNIILGYPQDGKVSEFRQAQTFVFPGRYRNEYDWGGSLSATELVPGKVTSISSKERWVREEPVRAAMERELYRNPLAIESSSGRILQVAYRERKGAFGDLVRTFSDFKTVDGLTVPFKVDESFNDKHVTSPIIRVDSVAINQSVQSKQD